MNKLLFFISWFSILMLSNSVYAQNKVVVIPINSSKNGIKVYDAGNQYIGNLLSLDYSNNSFEIFVPSLTKVLILSSNSGPPTIISATAAYYPFENCQPSDQYFVSFAQCWARLCWIKHPTDSTIKFASIPFINSGSVTRKAQSYWDGYNCISPVDFAVPALGIINETVFYKEQELPFTLPIQYPLRFESQ